MECLDDAALKALAGNKLSAQARAEAMAHVEQCASCDERLQQLLFGSEVATVDIGGSGVHPTEAEELADLSGTRLGRYMIIKPVGKGALGIVYSAYDPELDRRIAIKVLRQSVSASDDQLQENLRREARSMARLSHPNVVPVFDVGIVDRRLFIAMELIDGPTLGEWARGEPRSWQEIREVYYQAGQGLVAAHAAGLIYRDFKPSNVMIGRDGQVRVLDFGIAHAMANPMITQVPGGASVTSPSGGIGTPGYMAPEQYSIQQKIDARADQYAFCVSLYEALYGNRPFGGRTIEVVHRNTLERMWAEPQRDPGVPLWLRGAVVRGLSLDREQRFEDMPALLHALVKDKRSRRRQGMVLLAAVVGTALVTTAAVLTFRPELPPSELDRIEQLTNEAYAAAAQTLYVYPPAADPDAPTAYSVVLELERTEGEAALAAGERAEALREEFGGTLVGLGDYYYEREGGRPFAVDYYASALVFVADDEHARSRLTMTPGELASLRERAQERSFSAAELLAAESLVALAETDEDVRNEKLVAVQRSLGSGGLGTRDHVARLLGEWESPAAAGAPVERGAGVVPPALPPPEEALADPTGEDPAGQDPPVEVVPDARPTVSRPSQPAGEGAPTRDPTKAATLAKEAKDAFGANRLELAEKLYHRSLEFDPKNDAALTGLAELYFERGKYRNSLEFAKRAVARTPQSGKLWVLLGDAHFKVLEYAEARRDYDKARELGHPSADKRLEKLEKTVGK